MSIRNRLEQLERQYWDEVIEAAVDKLMRLPRAERDREIRELEEHLGIDPADSMLPQIGYRRTP